MDPVSCGCVSSELLDSFRLSCSFSEESYQANKSVLALFMANFFLRFLNLLYRKFEGDILLPIVLGEIAHHNVARFFSRRGDWAEICSQIQTIYNRARQTSPCNAHSISKATSIPRETVRRKIDSLLRKGWLKKGPQAEVFISNTVGEYFIENFNKALLREFLEASACLNRVLSSEKIPGPVSDDNQWLACTKTNK